VSRSRPKLLDLFCCEGGASRGYERAGFDVYGLDLFVDYAQKRYPFASHKGDAIAALTRLLAGEALPFTHKDGTVEWLKLSDFDAIAASPPCQRYSAGTKGLTKEQREKHPDLVGPTRELLIRTGLPFVMENVEGSPLRNPLMLCGTMFELGATDTDGIWLSLKRHRLFESQILLYPPGPCRHGLHPTAGVYGHGGQHKRRVFGGVYGGARNTHEGAKERGGGYVPKEKAVRAALLGLNPEEHTNAGLAQSIPPAYTEHIGRQLIAHLEERAA
jgi:DNA (cytosine-5)-methyltransferase 1